MVGLLFGATVVIDADGNMKRRLPRPAHIAQFCELDTAVIKSSIVSNSEAVSGLFLSLFTPTASEQKTRKIVVGSCLTGCKSGQVLVRR
ncbi:hypothetical protein MLPF_3254 [Mycobacterium lepromatosis]|nr:hypothetical protein MLPF_3254 [Mycobacterium lepromatosis]